MPAYETLLVEQHDAVTLITLNRPQALNALNSQVLAELLANIELPMDIKLTVDDHGDEWASSANRNSDGISEETSRLALWTLQQSQGETRYGNSPPERQKAPGSPGAFSHVRASLPAEEISRAEGARAPDRPPVVRFPPCIARGRR